MKEKTLKLSGHAKDRFLERFFADEPGLAADAVRRLSQRSKTAFACLRVRKSAFSAVRRNRTTAAPEVPPAPAELSTAPATQITEPAHQATPPEPAAPFDAYVFGLVPVFQREGRDGLLAKLATIEPVDHLRQMAKAQQVVLPQELRTGEVAAEALRTAIADAVAKRIADRRAAAG